MKTHFDVLIASWRAESSRRREARRRSIETAFLPAALEIMDTPPRPAGRIVLWLILGAAAFALSWASLSKIDVVAVAEGRIVHRGKLQSVEAAESGVVAALTVSEGAVVRKGEPLITLDPTYAEADTEAARAELAAATAQAARARALLSFAEDGVVADIVGDDAISSAERALVEARTRAFTARVEALRERKNAAERAGEQAAAEVGRLETTLPLARKRLSAYEALAVDGHIARAEVMTLEERVAELQSAFAVQRLEVEKSVSEAMTLTREIAEARQAFRAEAAAQLAEAETIIATRTELLEKARRRAALQVLAAPLDGIVNEIAIAGVGELAEPGQTLITIVPAGNELLVESYLLNKDVGFVRVNQKVAVKVEAYPFTRYGFLSGEVETVSADAVLDEQRGLVYPVRVRITSNNIRTPGADGPVRLAPGMAATVEIATGRRRVISYLLSPISKAMSEAGRER